jgi:hypothetical protein
VDENKMQERGEGLMQGASRTVLWLIAVGVLILVAGLAVYGGSKALQARGQRESAESTPMSGVALKTPAQTNAELVRKAQELTASFAIQAGEAGSSEGELEELRGREDLLLDHYSWIDPSRGRVRIPIERAIDLVVERGLPVAARENHRARMTGEMEPRVTAPLTDGVVESGDSQVQAEKRKEKR